MITGMEENRVIGTMEGQRFHRRLKCQQPMCQELKCLVQSNMEAIQISIAPKIQLASPSMGDRAAPRTLERKVAEIKKTRTQAPSIPLDPHLCLSQGFKILPETRMQMPKVIQVKLLAHHRTQSSQHLINRCTIVFKRVPNS